MLSMTIRGAISGLIMGISLGYIEGVKKTGEWFSAKHLAYMAIYGLAGLAIGAAVGAALGYIVSGGGGLVSINGTGAYGVFTRTVGKILDQALRIGSSQLGSLSLKLFLTGVVFGALTYAFTPDEFSDPISSSVFWSYVGTSGATAFLWELLKITGMVASRAFPGGWFVLPYAFVLGLNVGYFVPKGIHEGYDLISDFWMWIEDGIED